MFTAAPKIDTQVTPNNFDFHFDQYNKLYFNQSHFCRQSQGRLHLYSFPLRLQGRRTFQIPQLHRKVNITLPVTRLSFTPIIDTASIFDQIFYLTYYMKFSQHFNFAKGRENLLPRKLRDLILKVKLSSVATFVKRYLESFFPILL